MSRERFIHRRNSILYLWWNLCRTGYLLLRYNSNLSCKYVKRGGRGLHVCGSLLSWIFIVLFLQFVGPALQMDTLPAVRRDKGALIYWDTAPVMPTVLRTIPAVLMLSTCAIVGFQKWQHNPLNQDEINMDTWCYAQIVMLIPETTGQLTNHDNLHWFHCIAIYPSIFPLQYRQCLVLYYFNRLYWI